MTRWIHPETLVQPLYRVDKGAAKKRMVEGSTLKTTAVSWVLACFCIVRASVQMIATVAGTDWLSAAEYGLPSVEGLAVAAHGARGGASARIVQPFPMELVPANAIDSARVQITILAQNPNSGASGSAQRSGGLQ